MNKEPSATLVFISSFLRDLSAQTSLTSAADMAERVNRMINPPMRNNRALHLTNLIRRVSRDLKILVEEKSGKKILFGPNPYTLIPDMSDDAIAELAQKALDAINKYQRASSNAIKPTKEVGASLPTSRKGGGLRYTIEKEIDAFSVMK